MQLFGFDDDYVRRLREGDPWTQRHFAAYFERVIRMKLGGKLRPDVLEDVRQDVLLRVLDAVKAEKIREGARLGSYVNTTCNNVFLERLREQAKTEPLAENYDRPSPDESVIDTIVTRETQKRVHYVLSQLPPRDAAILEDVLDEVDKDEICRRHGINRAYLRVLIHRAKEHFRRWDRDHPDGIRHSH